MKGGWRGRKKGKEMRVLYDAVIFMMIFMNDVDNNSYSKTDNHGDNKHMMIVIVMMMTNERENDNIINSNSNEKDNDGNNDNDNRTTTNHNNKEQ